MTLSVDKFIKLNRRPRIRPFGDDDYKRNDGHRSHDRKVIGEVDEILREDEKATNNDEPSGGQGE